MPSSRLPREPGYSAHYWFDFLVILVLCAAVSAGVLGGCTRSIAGEREVAEASAALALAQAKRERVASKSSGSKGYHEDYQKAVRAANNARRPLVLWVGLKCEDYPRLCREFRGSVQCVVKSYRGNSEKRIVIRNPDGGEFTVSPKPQTTKSSGSRGRFVVSELFGPLGNLRQTALSDGTVVTYGPLGRVKSVVQE